MSKKKKLKELFEKLKAHCEKNNDSDLEFILNEYQEYLATQDEEDDKGGNNPEPPDIP